VKAELLRNAPDTARGRPNYKTATRWAVATLRTGVGLTERLIPVLIIIACWQLASDAFGISVLFPSPLATIQKGIQLVSAGSLPTDVAISLWRILCGFAAGTVLGALLGLLMGLSRTAHALLNPYVNTLRFIGPIAWIPMAMIWFGIDELGKIVLIVYTTTFVVLVNTMVGVSLIHRNKIRAAQCFGATPTQLFRSVTLPAALPHILTGMRLAMMNSFMTVVAAEMVAAQSGLGFLIFNSRQWMEVDSIFVGMLTLGALGLATDRLFLLVVRTFLWRYRLEG
jgi:NitT/TauT family transport system permease protein